MMMMFCILFIFSHFARTRTPKRETPKGEFSSSVTFRNPLHPFARTRFTSTALSSGVNFSIFGISIHHHSSPLVNFPILIRIIDKFVMSMNFQSGPCRWVDVMNNSYWDNFVWLLFIKGGCSIVVHLIQSKAFLFHILLHMTNRIELNYIECAIGVDICDNAWIGEMNSMRNMKWIDSDAQHLPFVL